MDKEKYVNLDILPKDTFGRVKWKQSIGLKLSFKYYEICGEIEILGTKRGKNNRTALEIKYNDTITTLGTDSVLGCALQKLIYPDRDKHKYNSGDIIKDDKRHILILEQLRMFKTDKLKKGRKYYRYKCLIDGNVDTISESHLLNGTGCNVCSNKKVLKGVNDVATTDPQLVKYFKNKDDAYNHTKYSKKKIIFKCPNCGYEKEMPLVTMSYQGLGCNKCSDGLSYPSKVMTNILEELKIDYMTEYKEDWTYNKRYDYYFKHNNEVYIIEIHGMQHYDGGFSRKKGKTLEEEQDNDKLKKELAIQNGIKEENYIIIDCRYSDFDFIKENVINSKIGDIFDLNNIDWNNVIIQSEKNVVKKICDLWNTGNFKNTLELSQEVKYGRSTVIGMLNRGKKIGWTDYDGKLEHKKALENNSNKNKKKVEILKDGKSLGIFESISELVKQSKNLFGVILHSSNITRVCNGYTDAYKEFTFRYIA